VICPFHLWCREDHAKQGSVDPLVLEERILLVMTTYAPNLWRVFLTYATDAVGMVTLLFIIIFFFVQFFVTFCVCFSVFFVFSGAGNYF